MTARRVLVRRYALALAELAAEKGRLDAVEQGLQRVVQAVLTDPSVRRTWYQARLSADKKVDSVRQAAGEGVEALVFQFLGVVARKGREELLPDMYEEFTLEADRIRQVVRVDVDTAAPLSEPDQEALRRMLQEMLHASGVRLSVRVNPELIGGLVVRAGDMKLDGSLSRQLARLHQQLRAAPLPQGAASMDGKAG